MRRTAMVQAAAVLAATGVISILSLAMIWQFLIALFLAAVFAGLSYPLYAWLEDRFGGKQNNSALTTLSILVLIVLLSVLVLLNLIALQAAELTEALMPWVRAQMAGADHGPFQVPEWVPFQTQLEAVRPRIMQKLGELGSNLGQFLVSGVSFATQGIAGFLLDLFVMLYAMFFFRPDAGSHQERFDRFAELLYVLHPGYHHERPDHRDRRQRDTGVHDGYPPTQSPAERVVPAARWH